MELKRFMIIEMLFFTILAVLSEWLGAKINKDLMYLTFLQALLLLMLIRWQGYGLIPVVVTAILRPFIFNYQGFIEYVLYSVPILILGTALIPIKLKWLYDINNRRYVSLTYFTLFYLLFFIANGVLIKVLISNSYSLISDFPKYLLSLVVGNIVYFLFYSQRTMLINVFENYQINEKDREKYGDD